MANLVSPGYSNSALVGMMLSPTEERVIEFKGLNKRSFIEEGEMSDMWNLSPDSYPLLMPRKPRGRMEVPEGILRPLQILRRFDKIGIIAIDEADPEEVDPQVVKDYLTMWEVETFVHHGGADPEGISLDGDEKTAITVALVVLTVSVDC